MSHQLTFTSVHNYATDAVIVPVELEFANKLVRTDAFIDTGATFCVFKRELAMALDIDVESGTPLRFSTVTGTFQAYGHIVTVKTFDYSFDVMVYFVAFEAFTRNVLGRRGWLDRVQLGLVEYESTLYLNRYGLV